MKPSIRQWFARPRRPQAGWVTLDHRHLYIVPTWSGVWFAVLLLTMLLASLNFNLNLGLILTFTLIGVSLAAMWFAYRNLQNLKVGAGPQAHRFAGESAVIHAIVSNPSKIVRLGVSLQYQRHKGDDVDLGPAQEASLSAAIGIWPRGVYPLGRFKIWSEFPFRLFHVWSYADLDQQLVVYPAPEDRPPPLPAPEGAEGTNSYLRQLSDAQPTLIRPYQQGDSLKQIAWKHSARLDDLVSRYGEEEIPSQLVFSWQQTTGLKDNEARLSRLCAWLLMAETANMSYGLSLPGIHVANGTGEAHLHHCLSALAGWKG